nr:zinc finger protein 26-like isoform X2 [Halyomorpha halys]
MADETGSACLNVKEEMAEETGYVYEFIPVKQEEKLLTPDDDEFVQVKQEEELVIPDDVHTIVIKQEEGLEYNYGVNDSDVEMESYLKDEINIDLEKSENTYQETSQFEDECSRDKATQNSYLKQNILSHHSDESPLQCPHCHYRAVHRGNLKKHMNRHTGEKQHHCSHCDYKSVTSAELRRHVMRRHTGVKPFQCPHCLNIKEEMADETASSCLNVNIKEEIVEENEYDYEFIQVKQEKELLIPDDGEKHLTY